MLEPTANEVAVLALTVNSAVIAVGAPTAGATTETVTATTITPLPINTFFAIFVLSVFFISCSFSTVVSPFSSKVKIYLSPWKYLSNSSRV